MAPERESTTAPASQTPASQTPASQTPASKTRADSKNMLPPRERRRNPLERVLMRLIATCGIVGIGVVIAAIMTSSHSQGWIIGLVVSIVSVVLAALLWSSRQL
jgi:protein-S-isoprenylcysteine O-methyltransferase Ste14